LKFSLSDEERSVSPLFSPGPVKNPELLLRVLYQPEHVKNGEAIVTAIPLDDLRAKGWSVDRKKYIKTELLKERITAQIQRNPGIREVSFASQLLCNDIRKIFDDVNGEREFLIVDEIDEKELPINKAHAAIYSVENPKNGVLRKLRSKLIEELNKNLITHDKLLQELAPIRNSTDNSELIRDDVQSNVFLMIAAILLFLLGFYVFFLGNTFRSLNGFVANRSWRRTRTRRLT